MNLFALLSAVLFFVVAAFYHSLHGDAVPRLVLASFGLWALHFSFEYLLGQKRVP